MMAEQTQGDTIWQCQRERWDIWGEDMPKNKLRGKKVNISFLAIKTNNTLQRQNKTMTAGVWVRWPPTEGLEFPARSLPHSYAHSVWRVSSLLRKQRHLCRAQNACRNISLPPPMDSRVRNWVSMSFTLRDHKPLMWTAGKTSWFIKTKHKQRLTLSKPNVGNRHQANFRQHCSQKITG